VVSEHNPKKVINIALPDEPVITGTSKEVFEYYKMGAKGLEERILELLE
jgi:Transketolase, C-terminal subunit